MKVLFYILNDADLLSPLLKEFTAEGINGCTIFDTDGMGRNLAKAQDGFSSMTTGLRSIMKPELEKTKTLMLILKDEKVKTAVDAIEKIVGNLDLPETGVVFTFDIDFAKGIKL